MTRWLTRLLGALAVGTQARIDLWRMLADLLDAGFSDEASLRIATETAQAQRQQLRAWLLRRWLRALLADRFAAEVSRWVPATEGLVLQAYDRVAGQKLFASAARVAEVRARQLSALARALAMPAVLAATMVLLLWAAGSEFIPIMARVSPPENWDLPAQLLAGAATWVHREIFLLLALFGAAALVLGAVMLAWTGPGRAALDRVPPFSLYRLLVGSAFIFVAVEYLRAGIDLNQRALETLKLSGSPYTASRISALQRLMLAGHGLGKAMMHARQGFPDPSLVPVVAALDGTDRWEQKLPGFVDRWVTRSEAALRSGAAVINGVLLLAITVMAAVGIQGMFQMMAAAQG